MKAAQIVAHRRIEIVEMDEPDISLWPEGSLLVKTHHTSLCGSDMPMFALEFPEVEYPFAPGYPIHECIGEIAESKSGQFKEATRFSPHRTVAVDSRNITSRMNYPPFRCQSLIAKIAS